MGSLFPSYLLTILECIPHLASQVNVDIQTLNHFGMLIETQRVKATPSFNDLVELMDYDGMGRVKRTYLPYVKATGSQNFSHMGYNANVYAYYTGSSKTASIAYNSVPNTQTVYDDSPLSRLLETSAPGANFALGTGHTVRTNLLMGDNNIAKYGVSINSSTFARGLTRATTTSVYNSEHAVKYAVKNENVTSVEGTTYEYKNREGQVILKRQINNNGSTETLSTYYVYDDLGNLCFVLPPKANADANGIPSQVVLDNLCYQYHYDNQQRMVAKKVPGKGWEYMVYNKLNQMVMSQDSVQRMKNPQQWNIIKYDASGRTVLTGIFASGTTPGANNRSAIQTSVDSQSAEWESRITTGNGYTNVTYPTSWTTTLSISYYDDYNFPGGNPYPYASSSGMTRGLLTGSKTGIIGSTDMLWGVNYYDIDGRVVRSFKQHYKGGTVAAGNYDEVSNTYDFTGAVLTSNRSHKVASTETLKSLTEYTYDHRGRKLDTWQTMNTGTRTLLSRMEYDDLGQPYKKKLHSTNSGSTFLQTVTYGYTERGWLKTAAAPLFSFELRYDNPASGGVAQYNGNISGFEYTAPTSGSKSFMYTYDRINRLLESTYSTASELNESILYDKNGNITWLRRGLSTNSPIYYTYANSSNSNQLSSVSGFKIGSFTYDGNGNALTDGMRGVTTTYNQLNLPSTITGPTAATYTYDAGGNKLRSVQGTLTTEYISGVHYKNNVLSFMSTDEGRVVRNSSTGAYTYEYSLKDHLGNVRVSFDDNSGTARLIQEDEYYAFGLARPKIVFGDKNNYLYNGKELQTALADVYDYGARFYDPVIGRWNVVDPLAELSRRWSPYNYVMNNPIRFIDPDGMAVSGINGGIRYTGADAQTLFNHLKNSFFQDDDKKKKREEQGQGYKPVPNGYKEEGLPGFPGSKLLPTRKGARTSWGLGKISPGGDGKKLPAGSWGEWDSKRGEVEIYNKEGKHQGARDPETGEDREGSQDPARKPTYNRISSEEPDGGKTIIQKGFQFPEIAPPPPGAAAKTGAMGATLTLLALFWMAIGG